MSDQTQVLEIQNAQRAESKYATLDRMLAKKRREDDFTVVLDEGDEPTRFHFVAITPMEYEELLTKHQPSDEDAGKGSDINPKTFPPALLAAVCAKPKLSEAEWRQVKESDGWGRAEFGTLYWRANNLCNRALEITPFEKG